MQDDGTPKWIEDELHNWSRWCWLGDWPGPGKPDDDEPMACEYPPGPGMDDEPPPPIPVCYDHALIVNRLYEALPLVEQRIIQAEYTRRREYGDMRMHERHAAASRKLEISVAYYRVALGLFKQAVGRAFQ